MTFFEEGQGVMNAEAQLVAAQFAGSAAFGGFAVHRYGEPYLGGVPDWPETNTSLSTPSAPALQPGGRVALVTLVFLTLALLRLRDG